MLGIAWALIQPLISMIILTFVFGYLAGLRHDSSVPYPLLVLSGVLPWQFFVSVLNSSSNSLVTNARLFTKVYFPRLMIPFSVIGVSLIDFLISFTLFAILAIGFFIFTPTDLYLISWRLIFIPLVFLPMAAFAALSIGIWFATFNVKYRDFRIVIPFIVQFGIFITPVGYSSEILEQFPILIYINPIVQIVEGFRWCLLGTETSLNAFGMLSSLTIIFGLLISGIMYFRSVENRMADVV